MRFFLKNNYILLIITLLFCQPLYAELDTLITPQKFNQSLYDQLPDSIRKTNEIVVVNDGDIPPYIIFADDKSMSGASVDFLTAIGELLGVTIKNERVAGLPALLLGIKTHRYDMAIGPVGDTPERHQHSDFIDYAASYAALAVLKGNPAKINLLQDACGKRISTVAGINAVDSDRIKHASEQCVSEGKAAIEVNEFKDQASAILALRSGRIDASYYGAPMLAYYVLNSKDEIELAGKRDIDSVPERYHAALVPKDSALGPVLLAAFQELFDNGTYLEIMKKWNLESNALTAPGMNLAE